MSACEVDKKCTQKILNINKHTSKWNRYNSWEILQIAKEHKENPEYTDVLTNMKAKTNSGFVRLLTGDDIVKISAAHRKEPEYTDYLLTLRNEDENGESLKFKGDEILKIVDAYKKDKELTNDLVHQTVQGKDGPIKRFDGGNINYIVDTAQKDKEFILYLINNKTIDKNGKEQYFLTPSDISSLAELGDKKEYLNILLENNKTKDENEKLNIHEIISIINNTTLTQYKNLEEKVGDNIKSYKGNDLLIAIDFNDLFEVHSINEIPIKAKKDLLRRLVSANTDMFNTSEAFNKDFPIIPHSQDEYCSLLPSLVRSLGIETNTLSEKQVEKFNRSLNNLSKTLSKLSDDEFYKTSVSQEYDKDEFVKDILKKVSVLSHKEKQKVFDYYGFELYENNRNTKSGYSIIGYPVNLNNGHKLSEITNKNTQKIVEDIRENVTRFSQNNKIISDNKNLEKELNDIVEVLPEIRTMIGKTQHKKHDYDVMKHSLKVMQKIAQDKNFEKLNNSDKKVMLLAALMHDITKAEGYSDGTHPFESSYDSFFIAKKFNLTKEEEIKLYTLIKNHEWLAKVNTKKTESERTKEQQSVAFDLQQSNLFDLSLIFTHADLKAVKKDNGLHDKTEGDARLDFNNKRRSFGEAAEFHAEKIREYVKELTRQGMCVDWSIHDKGKQVI